MLSSAAPIPAGMLMGFASSLHCAGMCGSIASALLLTTHPTPGDPRRMPMLVLTQSGRVIAYAVAGGILGAFGSGLAGAFDQTAAYRGLQWASAATLGWIGLSTAGLLPSPVVFDRLAAPIGGAILNLSARHAAFGIGAPVVTGIVWGFMPCAMVYGALLTAMLTGTGTGGALLMLGFGLGTLPGVLLAAAGIVSLRDIGHRPGLRQAIGFAIAAFGIVSVTIGPAGTVLCLPFR